MKNIVVFYTLVIFLFFILPSSVKAQQLSLSVDPSEYEMLVKPGKTVSLPFTVTNLGDPTTIRFHIHRLKVKDEIGSMEIIEEKEPVLDFRLDEKIPLDSPFLLLSKTSKQVELQVEVPEKTPEKDYYFLFAAESEPPPFTEGKSTIRLRSSVGAVILMSVMNERKIPSNIEIVLCDVRSTRKINLFGKTIDVFDTNEPIPVVLTVGNPGDHLLKVDGEISLKQMGKSLRRYELPLQTVLTESHKLLKTATPAKQDATLTLPSQVLGYYSVHAMIRDKNAVTTQYQSVSFIVVPIRLSIGIAVSTIVLIFIFIYIKYVNRS